MLHREQRAELWLKLIDPEQKYDLQFLELVFTCHIFQILCYAEQPRIVITCFLIVSPMRSLQPSTVTPKSDESKGWKNINYLILYTYMNTDQNSMADHVLWAVQQLEGPRKLVRLSVMVNSVICVQTSIKQYPDNWLERAN